VLAIAAERGELAQPIVAGAVPDLLAEAVYAARREQARTVGDVLLRRTRLALQAARDVAGDDSAARERVARAMAPDLGWDEARIATEVAAFTDEAAAEGIVVASPTTA